MERPNDLIPIETLFRHQSKELMQLRLDNENKQRTIRRLQHNIDLILGSHEVKLEIAKDKRIRQYRKQVAEAQKEVRRVRLAERKILETLLRYQLKEHEQSIRSN